MRATQHATNADMIALLAKMSEEESTAREYMTGEWVEMNDEVVDDFDLEEF